MRARKKVFFSAVTFGAAGTFGLLAFEGCTHNGGAQAIVGGDEEPSPGLPREDAGAVSDSGAGDEDSTSRSDESEDDPPPDPPNVPAVRFIGRFDRRDPDGPTCAWPGTRILANFRGDKVSVTLDERLDDWMVGGPSEWDVAIDGHWQPKLVLSGGRHTYDLVTGLSGTTHTIELYKRSEAQNGITLFGGFDFGEGSLLPPTPRKKRRIEIIGDSTAAAFGVEGKGPDCPGLQSAAQFENFRTSFGAVLGTTFDAEVYGTAYSGKGITQNVWRPDPETMPILYDRANPIDPSSHFDFSSFVPKVIVLSIGGIDFAIGQPSDEGPAPVDRFAAAYAAFLGTLRAHDPRAEIFCVVSPSTADFDGHPVRTTLERGVTSAVDLRRAGGDAKVHLVVPTLAPADELTGCEGHGNAAFHAHLAEQLARSIHDVVGW